MTDSLTQGLRAIPTAKDYLERWKEALRVLEEMTPHERLKHLDMSIWGQRTQCGTVACLAGHCSLKPWFRDRGFTSEFLPDAKGVVWLEFNGIRPLQFFGAGGNEVIFRASWRKYDEVVAVVKTHIAYLEAGGNPDLRPWDEDVGEDEDESD